MLGLTSSLVCGVPATTGYADGACAVAQFGVLGSVIGVSLLLDTTVMALLVADTGNGLLRSIDLNTRTCQTWILCTGGRILGPICCPA